jgi:ABC-type bacteriocin/lantibiotic exporter with double-glycine peptidase domain
MGGKIEIDGYDISTIGLDALRRNIALVPQDNVLFLGTLRQNMLVHWIHFCNYLKCLPATLTKLRRMLN